MRTETLDGKGQAAECEVKVYSLQQPERVHRSASQSGRYVRGSGDRPEKDLSNPNEWELAEEVAVETIATDGSGTGKVEFELAAGVYRVLLETKDRYGKSVTARLPLTVLAPDAKNLDLKVPQLLTTRKLSLQPGEEFQCL